MAGIIQEAENVIRFVVGEDKYELFHDVNPLPVLHAVLEGLVVLGVRVLLFVIALKETGSFFFSF